MRRGGRELRATDGDRCEVARFRYLLLLLRLMGAPDLDAHLDRSGLRPLQLRWLERYSAGQAADHGLRPVAG